MIKKEFEKETYLAPQWGMRTIRVERRFLNETSPWNEGGGGHYGDDDSNDNGDY